MSYKVRSLPALFLSRFRPLGVAAALGLAALAAGCGGSGSGSSAAVAPRPRPDFDLEHAVHPFDPQLVAQWPGLPNAGTSCYVNASIKLLAAMPELDPFLFANPADDAATAAVRTSLRRIINFIRSGGVQVGAPEMNARGLVQAVFAAFGQHPRLRSSVANINGGGGFVTTVVNNVFRVLDVQDQFQIRSVVKRTPVNHPLPRTYGLDAGNVLIISTHPDFGAYHFTHVHTMANFIELAYTQPGTFLTGGRDYTHTRVQTYPSRVPDQVLMEVNHPLPTRALAFSEQVAIPTYRVDQALGTETRQEEVPMRAVAAAVYRPGHVWAVIHGHDGWYRNDDATPSHRVAPTELDELADAGGNLTRNLELVLFQRSDR